VTRQTAIAVLLTAWILVVVELVNGLPPTWAWTVALAAFAAACVAARRLPSGETLPESTRRRSIQAAAGAIGAIALVPPALAVAGAIGLAGGLIAGAIVAAVGEYQLWNLTRPGARERLADAELVQ
jgi:hypothetical protein